MTVPPEPESKPPFLRRRWPYFVLGFLFALPAPQLGWFAFERVFFGGPTITVTVIEIDAPRGDFRLMRRDVAYDRPQAHFVGSRVVELHPVRTAKASAEVLVTYLNTTTEEVRTASAEIDLSGRDRDCRVVVRHRPEAIEISPCLRFVPDY